MRLTGGADKLDALYDGTEDATVVAVLAHGAGGDMNGEFMRMVAAGLAEAGIGALRFNFPYAQAGRKAPDRAPVLEETFAAVADSVRGIAPEARVVLGGKSMGGRIASQIVAGGHPADGLAFLGYPLHPPGRPDRLRDEHFEKISAPMLFIEGTRDPFCPLDTLRDVMKRRGFRADLVVIEGGDHSFKVRKSSGRSTREAWDEVVAALVAWIERLDA